MASDESSVYTRWVGRLWGIRRVINVIGNTLPERAKLKVRGLLAYDDPADASTVIELSTITGAQHGNLGGGALHAIATSIAAGFMSAADKTALDGLVTSVGSGPFWVVVDTVTDDYNAAVNEFVRVDMTGWVDPDVLTITLPAASAGNKGRRIAVRDISLGHGGTLRIATTGGQSLLPYGAPHNFPGNGDGAVVISTGTNWVWEAS